MNPKDSDKNQMKAAKKTNLTLKGSGMPYTPFRGIHIQTPGESSKCNGLPRECNGIQKNEDHDFSKIASKSQLYKDLVQRLGQTRFVTVAWVADSCEVSCGTVLRWITKGQIEAVNISSDVKHPFFRISTKSVRNFFKQRVCP